MKNKTLNFSPLKTGIALLCGMCLFLGGTGSAYAADEDSALQQSTVITVNGVVNDAAGEPVIGAGVVEKGTTNGSVTGLDGRFTLTSYGMVRDIANGRPYRYFMPTRHFYDMLVANMDWDGRFEKCFKWTWYVNDVSKCKDNPGRALGDTALFTPPYPVSDAQKEWAKGKYKIMDINEYFNPNSPNGEETSGPREMYAQLTKYLDPTRIDVGLMSSLDIPALRLGEMYLIAAEALMMNNKAAEGAEYINVLRKRGAKSDELYEAHKISASDMTIDLILDERAFELAGEGNRWVDLKRTGKLLELVAKYNVDARPNIKEKHLYRPIPTTMLDRVTNKDTFVQNPGY